MVYELSKPMLNQIEICKKLRNYDSETDATKHVCGPKPCVYALEVHVIPRVYIALNLYSFIYVAVLLDDVSIGYVPRFTMSMN